MFVYLARVASISSMFFVALLFALVAASVALLAAPVALFIRLLFTLVAASVVGAASAVEGGGGDGGGETPAPVEGAVRCSVGDSGGER